MSQLDANAQVSTAELQEVLRNQSKLVLFLAGTGQVVNPEDYPLLQRFMPTIFDRVKMVGIGAQLDQIHYDMGIVGTHEEPLGRLVAKVEMLREQAASLVNQTLADIDPVELDIEMEMGGGAGIGVGIFEQLQMAIALGCADSITKENFPSSQPPISYLRYKLAALDSAAMAWEARGKILDHDDGPDTGFKLKHPDDGLDYSLAIKFCQANVNQIAARQAELIYQFIEDHPDFPGNAELLTELSK